MDNLLVPACLLLCALTLFSLTQAAYWRKLAKKRERTALELAFKIGKARQEGCAEGWSAGARYQRGVLYLAAIKAGADANVIAALKNAGALPSESIVQVPIAS